MQVDPIEPALKAPGTTSLKLQYDGTLSRIAFNFNLRRYSKEPGAPPPAAAKAPPPPAAKPKAKPAPVVKKPTPVKSKKAAPAAAPVAAAAPPAGAYIRSLLSST